MLYSFLKFLVGIAVRVFFRSVEWKNEEKIPKGKVPLLFVANHPGTFMDPIVIASHIKQEVFFLAKAEVFRSKFAAWILPKFNVIPVYRKQDDATLMHKNDETFVRCYDHLSKRGCILIFPEGISLVERKLRKIKTGAARITLGAEANNDFKLGVKIVPIGINYSHTIQFQSNLFMNVGEPIEVGSYENAYKQDQFAAAEDLTDKIRERLEELIIAVKDDEIERLVKQIEIIYKAKILEERGVSVRDAAQDYDVTKRIADAVKHFSDTDPQRVTTIKSEVENYMSTLERLRISDKWLDSISKGGSILAGSLSTFLYLILGFPLYLFGLLTNYLPYKIPYFFARKMTDRPEFYAAIIMAIGIFTFIIFYSLQIYFVQHLFHNALLTLGCFILLPISGFFAYKYWKRFVNVKGKIVVVTLFMKRSAIISSLVNQRDNILKELQKGRTDYNKIYPPNIIQ